MWTNISQKIKNFTAKDWGRVVVELSIVGTLVGLMYATGVLQILVFVEGVWVPASAAAQVVGWLFATGGFFSVYYSMRRFGQWLNRDRG